MVLTRSWRFTAAMSGGLWNRAPVKHSRACREQHKTLRIALRRPEDIHTVRVCVQMCSALLRWNQALQTCTILLPSGCRRTLQQRARDQRERRPGDTQRMDKTRSSSHTTANRRANNLHYLLSEEKYSRLQNLNVRSKKHTNIEFDTNLTQTTAVAAHCWEPQNKNWFIFCHTKGVINFNLTTIADATL